VGYRIAADDRRARLGVRHALAQRSLGRPAGALASDVLVLHATDPATVFLSLAARSADLTPADITAALYDERALVRMLGMRRTMFVVPDDLVPVVQRSSSDQVAARLRTALVKHLAAAVDGPAEWLADVERSVHAILRASGGASATALSTAEPRLRTRLTYAEGKAYGGPTTITTRVLNLMAADGLIVRGRTRGSWTGAQYEWAPIEAWFPGGIPLLDPAAARARLVAGWLARFGPATVADVAWWTGWNQRDTRAALATVGAVEVHLEGAAGVALPDDMDPVPRPDPWIALLPALDPTPMGWVERDWYFPPEFKSILFDRTGNIGPTIWCDGRVVGGWAQRPSGEVVTRLLTDIGAEQTEAVHAEAARLQQWIGDARVIPKFRVPLDKELGPR
jgi:hypothetical protein